MDPTGPFRPGEGNTVSRALVIVLALALLQPAVAGAPGPRLEVAADTLSAAVGDAILVKVRLVEDDGTPIPDTSVALDSQSAATNDDGIATFLITRMDEGVAHLTATSAGAAPGAIDLAFLAPRLILDVPSTPFLDTPASVRAVLVWGANLTPVEGAALGLARDGVLLRTATTSASGGASFELPAPTAAGALSYEVVADAPLFAGLGARADVLWIARPAPPPPPSPSPPDPSAPVATPANRAPTMGAVSIHFAGLIASAQVDGLTDPDGDAVFLAFSWVVDGVSTLAPQVVVTRGAHVMLTVVAVDARGATTTLRAERVVPPDLPPIAHAQADGARFAGQQLVFDARGSSDPEGTPLTYAWAFSDGARAIGARVFHTFVSPGPARATLVVTDTEGASAAVEIDLVIQPAPQGMPPVFSSPANGKFDLPDGASIERVLSDGPYPRLLLATAEGLRFWTPTTGKLETVRPVTVASVGVKYAPRLIITHVDLGEANGWALARVRDPQPGSEFLGAYALDGPMLAWWRDGSDLLILTRESTLTLDHALPPLSLDARMEETTVAFEIAATVVGGAPIRSLRVVGPEGIIVDVTERTLSARVAPSGQARVFQVIVETLAGEKIERTFEVPASADDVPVEPATAGPQEVGAAQREGVPGSSLVWLVVGIALAGLVRTRRH